MLRVSGETSGIVSALYQILIRQEAQIFRLWTGDVVGCAASLRIPRPNLAALIPLFEI